MMEAARSLAAARGEACGKIILLGEHFVLPHDGAGDAPAVAMPLHGLSCEVEIALSRRHVCVAEDAPPEERATIEAKMARAVAAGARALGIDAAKLSVCSRTTLPLSRGFGSSAAFSVALARALDEIAERPASSCPTDLRAATHAVESIFHGTPSGLDTAVILAGRAIRFHRGELVRYVRGGGVDFVVVDSGPRASAAVMIARVRERRAHAPAAWSRLAARVTDLVDRCEAALSEGRADRVGALAREGHSILASLGLTNARIERVLADGAVAGALGGKVSGAGGGGAVLLVARGGDGGRLAASLRSLGHRVVAVST